MSKILKKTGSSCVACALLRTHHWGWSQCLSWNVMDKMWQKRSSFGWDISVYDELSSHVFVFSPHSKAAYCRFVSLCASSAGEKVGETFCVVRVEKCLKRMVECGYRNVWDAKCVVRYRCRRMSHQTYVWGMLCIIHYKATAQRWVSVTLHTCKQKPSSHFIRTERIVLQYISINHASQ